MKKFAIVLAGCGVYDGAEIHEATMSMYAVKKQGADYKIFAPDIEQHHVINHLTGDEMPEKRNVLVEAARIARGKIQPLTEFRAEDFDAILFPGGFGVAKNLCTFAFEGEDCKVNPQVEDALRAMKKAGKPIGALCISPILIAKIFGEVELTIGQDEQTANAVQGMGAMHKKTNHGEVIIDASQNVYTTPCYMLDASITDIADGAENIVRAILKSMY
jgi:enhancing lycopene biosynthesis protein 2